MEGTYDNKKATLELGTQPIGKLLWRYAMPGIIAMVASSLYNIIDRIFIGQVVGPLAISGLAITFPFMNLAGAFGEAIGIGASTAISMKLGQKDYHTAENLLGNTVVLNLIIGIAVGAICLVFLNPSLRFFGASDATLPYARSFMQIILSGNVIFQMYYGMNAVLRSASKPRQAMFATLFTVVMNIFLDMVFIWWLHFGIRGAACATLISMSLALIWQMKLLCNKKELLHLQKGIYKLKKRLVRLILSIGISPFLMNVCSCIIVIFMNRQLEHYGGDFAVGSYGIANGIATIFIMIVFGINLGMQPIASYNYGARLSDRLFRVLRYSIYGATAVMSSGWLIGELLPHYCAQMFTTDPTLIKMSAKAIQINQLMFPIIGFQVVTTNFFQFIGKVKISIFLSLSRQLLFLLPLLFVLPTFFGLDGVWSALPSADLIATITAACVLLFHLRKYKQAISTSGSKAGQEESSERYLKK
ncbi:MAG: MATE family efflux transporter [Prevotella sp.]|jgi:putative MATE family efflux protein|nr:MULTISPECIES: MATE family efflux transporter [unclassified Prevotella]MCH3970134.1 MATE family efflux transporter [Prevotella sp.]MCH3992514.1 MATE family efflux transporter [Prevotella sp.]MCH4016898.1 MATE family efflux transporter [Prevotella sp.]MCH4099062.1 MATE family efflux transporter [Prevotella sp.]MCH4186755.1 MATE family efflux transporter [Prevotella sp.]